MVLRELITEKDKLRSLSKTTCKHKSQVNKDLYGKSSTTKLLEENPGKHLHDIRTEKKVFLKKIPKHRS